MRKTLEPAELRGSWNDEVRAKRVFERLDTLLERARNAQRVATWGGASDIVDIALGLKELSLRYCIRVMDVQIALWKPYRDALQKMPEPSAFDSAWNSPENLYTTYNPQRLNGKTMDSIMLERVVSGLKPAAMVGADLREIAMGLGLMVRQTSDKRDIIAARRMIFSEVQELHMILRNFGHIHPLISKGLAETYHVAANMGIADWLVDKTRMGTTPATRWMVLDILQGLMFGYPILEIRSFARPRPFQSIRDIDFNNPSLPVPIEERNGIRFRRVLIDEDVVPSFVK